MEDRKRVVEGDEILFAFSAALLLYFVKSSVLASLFYWDELLVYVNPLRVMVEQGLSQMVLNGALFNSDHFFNHPPGMSLLLYPLVKIFGFTPFVLRMTMLVLFWGSMIYTYKLGKLVGGRALGLCAGGSLFAFPFLFSQSTMILGDNFFLFFSVTLMYSLLKGRNAWILLFLALLSGFIRETSLAFCPVIFLFYLWRRELSLNKILLSLAPALGVGLFLLSNKLHFGVWFKHQAFEIGDISLTHLYLKEAFAQSFLSGGKALLFFSGLGFFILQLFAKRRLGVRKELCFLALPPLFFFLFFSFDGGLLYRYFIPVFPFFALLCFYPLVQFSKGMSLLFLLLLVLRLPSESYGSSSFQIGTGYEDSMEYLEVQRVQREALAYIAKEHTQKRLWTRWPLDVMLSDSFYGYVPYSQKVVSPAEAQRGEFDIYVWASNMQNEFANVNERDLWIQKQKLRLLKSFYFKNKFVDIYTK